MIQIPDKPLDQPRPRAHSVDELPNPHPTPAELEEELAGSSSGITSADLSEVEVEEEEEEEAEPVSPLLVGRRPRRRLSTYESSDGGMDLEDDVIGGSARR